MRIRFLTLVITVEDEFNNSYLDCTSSRGVPWYVKTKKISENGTMGNPTRASVEKGIIIWEIMISHLVRFVEEIKNSSLEDIYQKKYYTGNENSKYPVLERGNKPYRTLYNRL